MATAGARSRAAASSACSAGASTVVRRALDRLLADPQLHRAEQGGERVHRSKRGVDEVRGRRLAVGPGDADRDESLAGLVVRPGGDRTGERARVVGQQDGHAVRQVTEDLATGRGP